MLVLKFNDSKFPFYTNKRQILPIYWLYTESDYNIYNIYTIFKKYCFTSSSQINPKTDK